MSVGLIMHTRLLCDGLRASITTSGSDGDIKSRRPASAAFCMPGPAPCGRTSSLSGQAEIPRYSCSGSQQDRQADKQEGRCKGLRIVAPHMPDAWDGHEGCEGCEGLAPGQAQAVHLGTWARGYINQQPGWQSTLAHMIGKQCTLPTGAGRFVGLRCNITQYLHVIIDTRTYE